MNPDLPIMSQDLQQEDWVQLWLSKLTPEQKALVVDIVQELQDRKEQKSTTGYSQTEDIAYESKFLEP